MTVTVTAPAGTESGEAATGSRDRRARSRSVREGATHRAGWPEPADPRSAGHPPVAPPLTDALTASAGPGPSAATPAVARNVAVARTASGRSRRRADGTAPLPHAPLRAARPMAIDLHAPRLPRRSRPPTDARAGPRVPPGGVRVSRGARPGRRRGRTPGRTSHRGGGPPSAGARSSDPGTPRRPRRRGPARRR